MKRILVVIFALAISHGASVGMASFIYWENYFIVGFGEWIVEYRYVYLILQIATFLASSILVGNYWVENND